MPDENVKVEIHVNLDNMLMGDLEMLEKPQTATEMLDVLQRVVVGADVRKMPLSMLPAIKDAILKAVQGMQSPN